MACRLVGAKPLCEPMLEYLIGAWGTNFSDIVIKIRTFSFEKMHLKMSSAKWRPFCQGLNVLIKTNLFLQLAWRLDASMEIYQHEL